MVTWPWTTSTVTRTVETSVATVMAMAATNRPTMGTIAMKRVLPAMRCAVVRRRSTSLRRRLFLAAICCRSVGSGAAETGTLGVGAGAASVFSSMCWATALVSFVLLPCGRFAFMR